jgi:hypothetical protein
LKRYFISFIIATCFSVLNAKAQVQYYAYNFTSSDSSLLRDHLGNPLVYGDETAEGNSEGFLLQIGYFENSTSENLFGNGTFVALLDFLTADSASSIEERSDGTFGLSFTLSATQGVRFPDATFPNSPEVQTFSTPISAGMYLALRWYDQEGYYNTVASTDWVVVLDTSASPPNAIETITFTNLVLESSGDSPTVLDGLRATLVPEPTLGALFFASTSILAFFRRRKMGA